MLKEVIRRSDKEYNIVLKYPDGKVFLKTYKRKLARGIMELAKENNLECVVAALAKPKEVKFKGL